MCLSAIYWAHIPTIYYAGTKDDVAKIGFDDAWLYDEFKLEASQRKLKMTTLLRDEAQKAYTLWESSITKISY